MKISTTFTLVVAFAVVFSTFARADYLTGNIAQNTWSTLTTSSGVHNVYVTPMRVTNNTTEQNDFLLFCGDFFTPTSVAYGSAEGQAYNAFAMASSSIDFYSDVQKSRINDLFGYSYASAFDLNGNILNGVYAQAIQLSVWSILHEETDNYNILGGSFRLSSNYNVEVVNATNALLSAVVGEIDWSTLGMCDFIDYDLTVYVADGGRHFSQTLISVTGSPNREEAHATPEPATMVVVGLGIAGLGALAARRRMKMRAAAALAGEEKTTETPS
jgi:hypothetical protein